MKKVWETPVVKEVSIKEVTLNSASGTVYDSAVLPGQPVGSNLS